MTKWGYKVVGEIKRKQIEKDIQGREISMEANIAAKVI